jgi:hypothetical protein
MFDDEFDLDHFFSKGFVVRKLKKENSSLRKQLARIDTQRFEHLEELVDQQAMEERQLDHKSKRQKLIEKWNCYKCEDGILKIIIINRPDGLHYFRRCNKCSNKTKLKRYSDEVEGIHDK